MSIRTAASAHASYVESGILDLDISLPLLCRALVESVRFAGKNPYAPGSEPIEHVFFTSIGFVIASIYEDRKNADVLADFAFIDRPTFDGEPSLKGVSIVQATCLIFGFA